MLCNKELSTKILSLYGFLITVIFRSYPLSINPTKWSNTLKQFIGELLTNCISVFDHFVGWRLKGKSNIYGNFLWGSLSDSHNRSWSYEFHHLKTGETLGETVCYYPFLYNAFLKDCIEIKIKLNFYYHTSLWCLKGFMKTFKAFTEPFETPQEDTTRSVKIKI